MLPANATEGKATLKAKANAVSYVSRLGELAFPDLLSS